MKLENIKDEIIIEEAVSRLKEKVKKSTGIELEHGDLIITLYQGACKKVEFNLRGRCFNKKPILLKGGM
jgi:hypothetical protein